MTARRLGHDFARLLAASITSNIGDGVRLAAGPLLVTSLTTDPFAVGAAVFVQQLPWLLVSLPVGAWVDRVDRRRLVAVVNAARALLAGALVALVVTDALSLVTLYALLFTVGTAEVIADNASSALVPAVVEADQLPRAYARLSVAFTVGNQFAGPPAGAWLFIAGAGWAFGVEAAAFAAAAVLVVGMSRGPAPAQGEPRTRGWMRRDVVEGAAWLWRHDALRLLAVVLAVMNVTFAAAFATWVLYARQRLGLGEAGFGLLLTASAAGALAGAALAGRLTDRFGPGTLLRAGMVVETAVLLALALTRSPWVAGAVMVAFGAHAAVWGVVSATVRQRLVPDRLRGRVSSVYFLLVMGGSALGALAGGYLAGALGLTGPFWIGAVADVVLTAAVWQMLTARRLQPDASAQGDPPQG